MALTKITKTGIGSGAVDGASIEADSITQTKIADGAIENEHLNTLVVTGLTELAEGRADGDFLIVYDSSTGSLKKIQGQNLGVLSPTISSISPTNVLTGDGTGNQSFVITGTNFAVGTTSVLLKSDGTEVAFSTLVRDSATQLTGTLAKSSLANADEPYDIKVTSNGLSTTLADQVNIDAQPAFVTASGSLGTILNGDRASTTFELEAGDPESAGPVGFFVASGSLPAGSTFVSNGDGTATIATFNEVASNTTSSFVVEAYDAASNVSTRSFSITVNAPVSTSFTSSGTFSVPSGITAVDVLVVGGGGGGGGNVGAGGGAGGLVFRPGFPVTPGGSVSVTIGDGRNSGPGDGQTGEDSVFGTLTAKGGGGGGGPAQIGLNGGSGGGGGNNTGNPPIGAGGQGIQATQPGDSGTYGFGNAGGRGDLRSAIFGGTTASSGGGGGAGASGPSGSNGSDPGPTSGSGNGGIGKAYTIADGTTPVYYAGGGGGGKGNPHGGLSNPNTDKRGTGGQGGGGDGTMQDFRGSTAGQNNKGGGGGGGSQGAGNAGGTGVVIVRY